MSGRRKRHGTDASAGENEKLRDHIEIKKADKLKAMIELHQFAQTTNENSKILRKEPNSQANLRSAKTLINKGIDQRERDSIQR